MIIFEYFEVYRPWQIVSSETGWLVDIIVEAQCTVTRNHFLSKLVAIPNT